MIHQFILCTFNFVGFPMVHATECKLGTREMLYHRMYHRNGRQWVTVLSTMIIFFCKIVVFMKRRGMNASVLKLSQWRN